MTLQFDLTMPVPGSSDQVLVSVIKCSDPEKGLYVNAPVAVIREKVDRPTLDYVMMVMKAGLLYLGESLKREEARLEVDNV